MTTTLTQNSGGLASAQIASRSLDTDRLVDEREAADLLGCKRQTLSVWRLRGEGPAFHKIGRLVRYKLSELTAYVDSRRCSNTAEADAL